MKKVTIVLKNGSKETGILRGEDARQEKIVLGQLFNGIEMPIHIHKKNIETIQYN